MSGRPAEVIVLQKKFSYLVNSIDADSLVSAAHSAGLLTQAQQSDCLAESNVHKKSEKFVGHIQRRVNGDTNSFATFLDILGENDQEYIASNLRG